MTSVAILLPYYNYKEGLGRSLESLRSETDAFTLFIVDDGTVPPLEINPDQYNFPIRILRLEHNGGIVAALNAGLDRVLAENYSYLARLDTGDLWVPGRIAAQRNFLEANPGYVLVGCWAKAWALSKSGTHLDKFLLRCPESDAEIRQLMRINSSFCHPGVMIRVDAIRRAGSYSTKYPAAEDFDFFWRLLDIGKGANLPRPWLKYEIASHTSSITYHRHRRQLISRLKIQLEHFSISEAFSWWGIFRTLVLICVPYDLVLAVKSRFWREAE